MTKDLSVVIVGAGSRGTHYAELLAGEGVQVVAVADPDPERRERLAVAHGIPAERQFSDWRELAARERLAAAAVVATQDREHADPCIALAGLGYHLMLEKPMALTQVEAEAIAAAVDEAGVMLAVCHVLRYTPYSRVLKEMIELGRIGDVVSVQHLEPIGWWHFAHSYVRGNWRRSEDASSMLLAKACHDLDWLSHILDREPVRVSSFGELTHFRAEHQPAGAADRCLDCSVEATCAYSAPRLYLGCLGDPSREEWPLGPVTLTPTKESVNAALRDGPYGRCVYACDNDVVDQQVVNVEYAGGVTAAVTVVAFTFLEHRKTRIFGTRGMIDGDGLRLVVDDFVTGKREEILVGEAGASAADGHGGGDEGLVRAFATALRTGDRSHILSGPHDSLKSHQLVWAAEESRLAGQTVAL